jgi:hypothetical protein
MPESKHERQKKEMERLRVEFPALPLDAPEIERYLYVISNSLLLIAETLNENINVDARVENIN